MSIKLSEQAGAQNSALFHFRMLDIWHSEVLATKNQGWGQFYQNKIPHFGRNYAQETSALKINLCVKKGVYSNGNIGPLV